MHIEVRPQNMQEHDREMAADYIVVQALEDGVNVIGMTRGRDTRLQHTERLSRGEVLVAQFTDNVSAIKVSGRAQVLTKHGEICPLPGDAPGEQKPPGF